MTKFRTPLATCIVALLMAPAALSAQERPLPRPVSEFLDHRIGQWRVITDVLGADGNVVETETEEHSARAIMEGRMVEISGRIDSRLDFTAWMFANGDAKTLHYMTVDRTGHHADLSASFEQPHAFVSTPMPAPGGGTMLFRLSFSQIEPDSMRCRGEMSTDDGHTWRRVYEQRFERVAVVASAATVPEKGVSLHRPVYFPDGRSLLYMSDVDGGDWELYRVRRDGSAAERITRHVGWDGYADIAPDSRTIVFDRGGENGRGIMIADLLDGTQEWLVRGREEHLGGARFAPDGLSVVYQSEESGSRELYRLWLADRRSQRLTTTDHDEKDAAFAPDGRKIAYAVDLGDQGSALEILDLDHATTHHVLTTPGRLYGVGWTRDGRHLLYNDDSDGDQEIYIVGLDGGAPRKLTDNEVPDHLPVGAPDRDEIVFTSERDTGEQIFFMDLASGATTRLQIEGATPPPAAPAATARPGQPLAIVAVNVVAMESPAVRRGVTVLVREGRIEAIGPVGEIDVPDDAFRIDGSGHYLAPGLIDGHVHMRRANTLRLYLARGFTTVRDMNGNLSATRAARDLVAAGELLGSRVVAASPTMLDDAFRDYPHPSTLEEGRALVSRFREDQYDLIKIFRVHREGFRGLMQAAREAGMPVAGHVPNIGMDDPASQDAIPFAEILASGVTSLEHIVEVAQAGLGDAGSLDRLPEVASAIARAGIAVGTLAEITLDYNRIQEDRAAWLEEHGSPIRRLAGEVGIEEIRSMDVEAWEPVAEERVVAVIRAFHDAGVKLIMGTDSHHPVALGGHAGIEEIEFLVHAGLSPYAALRAATVDAAEVLGLGDETGRVAAGLAADLLLLEANPLESTATLGEPVGVIARGRWLDRAALAALAASAIIEGLW